MCATVHLAENRWCMGARVHGCQIHGLDISILGSVINHDATRGPCVCATLQVASGYYYLAVRNMPSSASQKRGKLKDLVRSSSTLAALHCASLSRRGSRCAAPRGHVDKTYAGKLRGTPCNVDVLTT